MKANICLEDGLYNWLEEVRKATDTRSVPDVIRHILTEFRKASTSNDSQRILFGLLDYTTAPITRSIIDEILGTDGRPPQSKND